MKQFTYTIKDELGVHARPAGLLVKLATASVPPRRRRKTRWQSWSLAS